MTLQVIPRGSNALVSHIKANTKIPVMGHADGICHIYVDTAADIDEACRCSSLICGNTDCFDACCRPKYMMIITELGPLPCCAKARSC